MKYYLNLMNDMIYRTGTDGSGMAECKEIGSGSWVPSKWPNLEMPEAVDHFMEVSQDMEDIYLAEQALADIRLGLVKPIPMDEISKRLGLEE